MHVHNYSLWSLLRKKALFTWGSMSQDLLAATFGTLRSPAALNHLPVMSDVNAKYIFDRGKLEMEIGAI